jgi:quercetin dioxygenase-like cupin family protein
MTDDSVSPALTVIDDIRAGAGIPAQGLGHTTALTHPDVRVVVLSFAAGHVLREHAAPYPLLMQALDGELLVRADGRETRLVPGGLLRLDAALRHEVEAVADSRLMLTLVTR